MRCYIKILSRLKARGCLIGWRSGEAEKIRKIFDFGFERAVDLCYIKNSLPLMRGLLIEN